MKTWDIPRSDILRLCKIWVDDIAGKQPVAATVFPISWDDTYFARSEYLLFVWENTVEALLLNITNSRSKSIKF